MILPISVSLPDCATAPASFGSVSIIARSREKVGSGVSPVPPSGSSTGNIGAGAYACWNRPGMELAAAALARSASDSSAVFWVAALR
jgi:hypothetical protein